MPRRRTPSAVKKKAKPPLRPQPVVASVVPKALRYKVVELSNVDEGAIERTVNEWVGQGWAFDGVQFAMRESSKRPAMAFVFFTREGLLVEPAHAAMSEADNDAFREKDVADAHLRRIVLGDEVKAPAARTMNDAWARLAELADVAEEPES